MIQKSFFATVGSTLLMVGCATVDATPESANALPMEKIYAELGSGTSMVCLDDGDLTFFNSSPKSVFMRQNHNIYLIETHHICQSLPDANFVDFVQGTQCLTSRDELRAWSENALSECPIKSIRKWEAEKA